MEYFVGDVIAYPMIKDAVFLVKEVIVVPDALGDYKTLLCSKRGEEGIAKIHANNKNITLKWRLPENRTGENL